MLSFFRKKSESDIAASSTIASPAAAITTTGSPTTASSSSSISMGLGSMQIGAGNAPANIPIDKNSNNNKTIVVEDRINMLKKLGYANEQELKETIYDILRTIRDPEKPSTLEDLHVVYEDGIFIQNPTSDNVQVIRVEFNPTVPHCSLATLIGLCIRIKIERNIPHKIKLDIYIKKGAHTTEHEINKQINDKERIAAAMENPNLRDLVEQCIKEED